MTGHINGEHNENSYDDEEGATADYTDSVAQRWFSVMLGYHLISIARSKGAGNMSGAGDSGPGISGDDSGRHDPARPSEPDPPRPVEVHDGQGTQVGHDNTQHNQYGGTHTEAARDAYAAETINIHNYGSVPDEHAAAPDAPARPVGAPAVTVTIEAALSEDGSLAFRVRHGDSVLCEQRSPLPREVADVWSALALPGLIASDRMIDAGRRLAGTLFDDSGQRTLAAQFRQLPPGAWAEVVLVADGPLLSLPIELIRLSAASEGGVSAETGPLGLLPNVSVLRRVNPGGPVEGSNPPPPTPGPLKILAAVAAPDETKTKNVPLDTEAEMGAVLDAVSAVAGDSRAQVRILEVASLAAIREALQADAQPS